MKKYITFLLVGLLVGMVALVGCGPAPPSTVILESPPNGSTVSSLTPILTWSPSTSGATYRIQVSNDSSFGSLVIDQANLAGLSYNVPSGNLSEGKTYYWKVQASVDSTVANWSPYWSFQTPAAAAGTIRVGATLDGSSWTGEVNYNISGPQTYSGSSVTQSFSNVPAGSYTVGYSSGGPDGATLADITPTSTQTLSSGVTITFTLNFVSEAISTISVRATLDGKSWTGTVYYDISGPKTMSGSSVSKTFSNLPVGTYTVTYDYGGPSGATLASITPQPTQTTVAGSTTTFYLNFYSEATSTIRVRATLDGESWTGTVYYDISGSKSMSGSSVSKTFSNLPIGTYTVTYHSRGPSGATLISITPQPRQTTVAGKTTTFYLDFVSEATSMVRVTATLDGKSWSGPLHWEGTGPRGDSDDFFSVPEMASNLPAGTYAINYYSGGPAGTTFTGISPSPLQTVSDGCTITFNFEFHSQANGTVRVRATKDGASWSGNVSYTIQGPYTDSHHSVPNNFGSVPAGTYTLVYRHGGPEGCVLDRISPSATLELSPGGTITFTLNFVCLYTTQPLPEPGPEPY